LPVCIVPTIGPCVQHAQTGLAGVAHGNQSGLNPTLDGKVPGKECFSNMDINILDDILGHSGSDAGENELLYSEDDNISKEIHWLTVFQEHQLKKKENSKKSQELIQNIGIFLMISCFLILFSQN
jgi:hypothetical protein